MEVLFGEIQCHPAAISGFFLLVVKIHELMVCWTHGPGSTNSFGSQVCNASMKALCWYRLFPMETSRGEVRAGNPTQPRWVYAAAVLIHFRMAACSMAKVPKFSHGESLESS